MKTYKRSYERLQKEQKYISTAGFSEKGTRCKIIALETNGDKNKRITASTEVLDLQKIENFVLQVLRN